MLFRCANPHFLQKWYKQYKYSVYRLEQKNFSILWSITEIFLNAFRNSFIKLNQVKLTRPIQVCKNIFAIKMVLIFLILSYKILQVRLF